MFVERRRGKIRTLLVDRAGGVRQAHDMQSCPLDLEMDTRLRVYEIVDNSTLQEYIILSIYTHKLVGMTGQGDIDLQMHD